MLINSCLPTQHLLFAIHCNLQVCLESKQRLFIKITTFVLILAILFILQVCYDFKQVLFINAAYLVRINTSIHILGILILNKVLLLFTTHSDFLLS